IEHDLRLVTPQLAHDVVDLFFQRALALTVVGRVARDELLDQRAERSRLERGERDLDRLRAFLLCHAGVPPRLGVKYVRIAMADRPPLEITVSRHFLSWLHDSG